VGLLEVGFLKVDGGQRSSGSGGAGDGGEETDEEVNPSPVSVKKPAECDVAILATQRVIRYLLLYWGTSLFFLFSSSLSYICAIDLPAHTPINRTPARLSSKL